MRGEYGWFAPAGCGEERPGRQTVQVVLPSTSGTAAASLTFGIVGAVAGLCMLGVPCLAAVLCGHLAMSDIRRKGTAGRGMAVAGLVLGYLFAVPWLAAAVLVGLGVIPLPSGLGGVAP